MDVFYRIRFHISMFFRGLLIDLEDFIHRKTAKDYLDEFWTRCAEISPEDSEDIEQTIEEHLFNEPQLDPRRTMLFQSRPEEHDCNTLTAALYRNRVLNTLVWAKEHGITTFLADYSTPFGLLALEILVELRKHDDSFRVYSVKSQFFSNRKTYRTIPETGVEMAILSTSADYSFNTMPPETIQRILPNAATHCTESGLWIAKDKLPPYLLEAWEM